MPLNNNQANLYAVVGTSAENLNAALLAFAAAHTATATATAIELAAKTDLDAAWTDFVARDGAFDSAMLVPPSGYTPPPATP